LQIGACFCHQWRVIFAICKKKAVSFSCTPAISIQFPNEFNFWLFYLTDYKKYIPQNVVSTHIDDIPHIEIFFCEPIHQTTYDFCSAARQISTA